MFAEPVGFDRDELAETLRASWGIEVAGLCLQMTGGYVVSVFSFIEGTSHPYGEFPTNSERWQVLAALGRMHAATGTMPADLPERDSLEIPNRQEFFEALQDLRTAWTGGPYAEPAWQLVRARTGMVGDLFARNDALVPAVRSTSDGWVVTHGEPHAGNVMRSDDGGIRLIDWDTAALGPRERDLWMIEPRSDEDSVAYNCATSVDPAAMEFYRLRWVLSEICGPRARLCPD